MVLGVYCDTNVFVDYFRMRKDRLRPLADFAFMFFSKGWNCSFKLIISDWLIKELRHHLEEHEIEMIFNEFRVKGKLIEIKQTKEDIEKAKMSSHHWQDALHAVLANKAQADYLATRNIRDYACRESLVEIVLPEFI